MLRSWELQPGFPCGSQGPNPPLEPSLSVFQQEAGVRNRPGSGTEALICTIQASKRRLHYIAKYPLMFTYLN